MKVSGRLFSLLASYDESDVTMQQFFAAWSEKVSIEEVTRILHADLETSTPAHFDNWGPGSDGTGDEESGVLIGQVGTWTLTVGDRCCTSDDSLSALSQSKGRALSIEWDPDNRDPTIKYAIDGKVITSMNIIDTADRSGVNPDALDAYMEGLRFDVDSDDAVEPNESFTSALIMIGRITGHELDSSWLDATHVCYTIHASEDE
ncbi:DUF6461 domain-containing protein [Streptosporangium sp. NPDC023615]|uniref:DUF6461 domain-containing protein n=1 Tax=Streptosporangium sp. NPDC023615 TaxID=3154794 RepID=UPI0034315439